MDCIFNKEKLKKVLCDFYESTGVAIALYDSEKNIVASSSIYSGYCSAIRTKKICVESCDRSNLIHMKGVSKDRRILRYTCHAGLMETILPVIYDDVLIAYLQIGQFCDEDRVYSSADKVKDTAKRYGFSEKELLRLYENVTVLSEKKLSAACNITEILVKSFWEDGLISYNRSMLSVKIEHYIDSRLKEKISIEDICKSFFISKNALYALFRDEFGTTVNEFIVQKQLNLAKELLFSEPELNVAQISAKCGFQDYNYFIRAFKKREGITPLRYRKTADKKQS